MEQRLILHIMINLAAFDLNILQQQRLIPTWAYISLLLKGKVRDLEKHLET